MSEKSENKNQKLSQAGKKGGDKVHRTYGPGYLRHIGNNGAQKLMDKYGPGYHRLIRQGIKPSRESGDAKNEV
jgi:hypothetical protein